MKSGTIGLGQPFLDSDEWNKPRVFSPQEARLDLVLCATFGIPGALDRSIDPEGRLKAPERILESRWQWSRYAVRLFVERRIEAGDIGVLKVGRGRVLLPATPMDIRLPSAVAPKAPKEDLAALAAEAMHRVWQKEFNEPGIKLTKIRVEKYTGFYNEIIKDSSLEIEEVMRRICAAVKKSSHHMSKRSYQFPESLFINDSRRERWFHDAMGATPTSASASADLDRWEELAKGREAGDTEADTPAPEDRVALRAWYDAQSERGQAVMVEEAEARFKLVGGDEEMKRACFYAVISERKEELGE